MAKVQMAAMCVGMTALVGIGVAGGLRLMAASEPAKVVQTLPLPLGAHAADEADFAKTLGQLEADERKLLNLHVEAEAWQEEYVGPPDNWRRIATDFKVGAWLDGKPGGPARFDVTSHVPWIDGAGPVAETTYTAAWDGTQSRYLLRSTGLPGKAGERDVADISGDIIPTVSDRMMDFATGCAFSTPLWMRSESKALSGELAAEAFTARTVQKHAIRVVPVKQGQAEYLSVRITMEKFRDKTWVVDPARAHALMSITETSPDGSVLELRVLKLVEAGGGVWWPMEACADMPMAKGQPRQRLHYKASKAIANDPAFDRSVFTPLLAPGCNVNDKTTGMSYMVPPTPQPLDKNSGKRETP